MNEQDRKTRYQGIAKLLLEITSNNEQVMAERVFDIVGYVIDKLSSYEYDTAVDDKQLFDAVPDFTEWPPIRERTTFNLYPKLE